MHEVTPSCPCSLLLPRCKRLQAATSQAAQSPPPNRAPTAQWGGGAAREPWRHWLLRPRERPQGRGVRAYVLGSLVGGVSPASPWALPSGPLACSRTFGCSVVLASCSPRLPVSWPAAGLRGGEGTSPAVAPCLGRAPGPTHLLPCLLPASVWGHRPVLPPASAPPPMHSEQHPWPVPAFCARRPVPSSPCWLPGRTHRSGTCTDSRLEASSIV